MNREEKIAMMQIEHDRKVIEAFAKNPSENVASVCLEVGGVEHTILIHEPDYPKLVSLLKSCNHEEEERLVGEKSGEGDNDAREDSDHNTSIHSGKEVSDV